jgi:hypothetical protein
VKNQAKADRDLVSEKEPELLDCLRFRLALRLRVMGKLPLPLAPRAHELERRYSIPIIKVRALGQLHLALTAKARAH